MTKRNPEFGGFSACFAVRTETDQKGKATPPARTETVYLTTRSLLIRFQPTPPARTETLLNRGMPIEQVFQPTPPARTETETLSEKLREVRAFQPTPPARTETQKQSYRSGGKDISTHSAREDGDAVIMSLGTSPNPFQPTPPARTETAILHKKTNNSSSHFHNQITSYSLKSPPTYPAHIQSRFHCAVFPVRIPP